MVSLLSLYLVAVKGVILLAGGSIVYYTARAAQRTGDEGLWLLTVGLVASGAGLLLAGVLPDLIDIGEPMSEALTNTLAATGLLLVVFSMVGVLENPPP